MTWHGATGLDYHKAVFQAFQTGDALREALSFTNGDDVTVAAHSLGNMVVSHAIQSGGFTPARYYMINAAVALEAYEFANVDDQQRTDMVEHDWKTTDQDLFSANWHKLFMSMPDDHRNELTWKDRFMDVLPRVNNFYSPGEDVLAAIPEVDSASVLATILRQGFNFSRGSWKAQELVKGVNWTTSLADLFLERGQAGWDKNSYYSSAPGDKEQLKTQPFFDKLLEPELTGNDPTIASAKAAEPKVQYDLLARGLPAMSNAVARNKITALESVSRNFDMEADGRMPGRWPTEGHDDDKTRGHWLHNDFKNVALPYLSKMYEAMIAKGPLK